MSEYDFIDFEAGWKVLRRFVQLYESLQGGEPSLLASTNCVPIEIVGAKNVADTFLRREGHLLNKYSDLADKLVTKASNGTINFDKESFFKEHEEWKRLADLGRSIRRIGPREIEELIENSISWQDLLRDASRLRAPMSALLEPICDLFAAGYHPLSWHGAYPDGHLVVYVPPGARPLPPEWQKMMVVEGIAEQPPRKPLDRFQFGEPDLPVEPSTGWDAWLSLTPPQALEAAFGPLLHGADPWAVPLLAALARRVEGVQVTGSGARRRLVFTVRPVNTPYVRTITCEPPHEGPLVGLNAVTGRVLRRFNGIVSSAGNPAVTWLPYYTRTGFAIAEWEIWEPVDNYDGLWNKPPLVPITDGSDLWLYHPLEREGDYLRLVRLNHEDAGIEPAYTQHPFALFIRLCVIHLGMEFPE